MSKARSKTAFWYDGVSLIPIYEGEFHGYFLLFHPEELGISPQEIENAAIEYGYTSLQEAYDELKDPDNMVEYNWFWRKLMEIAIKEHHLLRLGSYSSDSHGEIYISCYKLSRDAGSIMNCLIENKTKLHCNERYYYIAEELDHEISTHTDKHLAPEKGCVETVGFSNFLEALSNVNY